MPVPMPMPVPAPVAVEATFSEHYVLDLPELRATAERVTRPARVDAAAKLEPRRLMLRVARLQVVVAMVAMLSAPLLTLATGRTSALAFALHGVGAMLMFGVATLAMHKAYPLLRGSSRSWPSFKTALGRLAACSVVEGISGMWLLYYYHAESGPGHVLADTAPLVDQLAMNIKLYCGLAAIILSIAAWWSARLVREDHQRGMIVPALAVSAAWLAMVCALALGLGVALVMPA